MSTGFHPHTHLLALASEVAIKLFRSLTVFQSLLSTISRFGIHKRNFLEARVIIASYNDHCPAPFYPSLFGWLAPPKLTRASEPALSWNQYSAPVYLDALALASISVLPITLPSLCVATNLSATEGAMRSGLFSFCDRSQRSSRAATAFSALLFGGVCDHAEFENRKKHVTHQANILVIQRLS